MTILVHPIPPGSMIGIFGGGQLGRMATLAAARLGYRCHVFTPDTDSPAAQVAMATTVAPYEDVTALRAFAATVDVATFEFENIPIDSMRLVAEQIPVRPGWKVLEVAQDRVQEKIFFNTIGLQTAPWRRVVDQDNLAQAVMELGRPSLLKTARFGYDGKGQIRIDEHTGLEHAWHHIGAGIGVLEAVIDFTHEVSVIVARGTDGSWAAFDPAENIHVNHMLQTSLVPARLPAPLVEAAVEAGRRTAEILDMVGVLAVEMFVTREGHLLMNEMAPRPHNSGHWTLDACLTDQFEQFIRAVCGLPLGSPERHFDAEMLNLLGDDVVRWLDILEDPRARLHLYGKEDVRPGRKMGHVTHLKSRTSISTSVRPP
ncbi:Phosphoribosylaminoimidazole carboxylase ATPase subunit [invertebrate metagenome]|uniref:Phosphoribosylaminoimidazole carboxylase ATPase subunit n=1 Tax=invertebrate metagenome TaxID=1711999 RepID=A0A484H553_9ZZZZ